MNNADAFTTTQMTNNTIGIADSNAQMFEEPTGQKDQRAALRSGGANLVPMSSPLDAPPFTANDSTTYTALWDAGDNPFNFSGSHVMTIPQVAWYYGHCGPDPMDQEFIARPGEPTTGLEAALDQFGPGGSDHSENCSPSTDDWGGIPFED
jgi:hypothetical protein